MERSLEYKVVELSTVDEIALERTVNHWVQRGWSLDGVQFAMRDSSKRPAMAFVFFTREGPALAVEVDGAAARGAVPSETLSPGLHAPDLSVAPGSPTAEPPREPSTGWARLVEMAGEDAPPGGATSGETVGTGVGGASREPGDED